MKDLPKLEQMPALPKGNAFSLVKIEKIFIPHPYCITNWHVAEAADHWGGMLGEEAIKAAEQKGACCDICRHRGPILKFEQHENQVTLFIRILAGIRNLNEIDGLHKYLFENKATFEGLGIQGFAFPS